MSDELRKQVVDQFRVVAHMATAIAQVHSDNAIIYGGVLKPGDDALFDLMGRWSAERMEVLGDMLNGMDAVTEEDDWTHPIFEEAQRRWPSPVPAGQPTDADWRAFGASDAACYLWPEDTEEHRNLRAAYVRGAADCGGAVSAGQREKS